MSTESKIELQFQETSAKPYTYKSQCKTCTHTTCNQSRHHGKHIACSINNIAKFVNQAHKPHTIRRNTTAYTENKAQSNYTPHEDLEEEVDDDDRNKEDAFEDEDNDEKTDKSDKDTEEMEKNEACEEPHLSQPRLLEMSTESKFELQFQETSAKPHKSQAVALSCNIPKFVKIVNHAHIPHAIRADTTVDTACSINNIAKIVNKSHEPHAIRADTTANTACNFPQHCYDCE